jgi:uncharacterized protein (TIGR03086 family)
MTNDTLTPEAPAHLLADPRPALTSALATCGDLIHTVRPEELDRVTPCDDMDVRALLGHLVMVAQRIGCAARMVPTHEWPSDVVGLADDEWAPAFHEAATDALAAWSDDALLDVVMVLPWATMPGREVVGIYTNEVVVHGWDLGRGTGREPSWPSEALVVAEAAIHIQLPDADRGPMWAGVQASLPPEVPWADPFANAVEVPADAAPIERVVAWNGRQP